MKPNREQVKSSLQNLSSKASEHDDVQYDVQWDDLTLVIETDDVLAQITHWPQEHYHEGSTEWLVHEVATDAEISPHHATWATYQELEQIQRTFLMALRDVAGIDLL
jgi:hypothetical protein